MIDTVLFDMDGVLINSEPYYVDNTFKWMKEHGFKGDKKEIHKLVGTHMDQTYQLISEMFNGSVSISEAKRLNENHFKNNPLDYPSVLKSESEEVLKILKGEGYKIGLCSSSSRKDIEKMLKTCNLEKYFDFYVSGEEFNESKPNPEIYICAAKKLGSDVENCLVVEDSPFGITAGIRANMSVLAVKDLEFNLDQSHATKIISNLSEIITWLNLNKE
ncbi:MAG: HAD family hydrolase [Anaerorhabdus sp.]